jgi:ABC-type glycerol-3-phosphate transport system substrate-binding protein
MKKTTSLLALTSLVLSLLLSCSSQELTESKKEIVVQNQKRTKVKWLAQWFGEGMKETIIHEIVRDFSFLNQDIEVEMVFPHQLTKTDSNFNNFYMVVDSISKWASTNVWPYDLMLCDSYHYINIANRINDKYWGGKLLTDFSNEKWFIDAHKDYVLEVDEYKGKYGGIAPGAFIEGAWNLLYASSEVEDKLGIKVKDYDMTIDDFIEYAIAVDNYNKAHSDKITFFSMNYNNGLDHLINHLVKSEIGNDNKKAKADPYVTLSNVYEKLETLAKYNPIEQHHAFNSDRELLHDKVLFHYHSTWVSMFWQKTNPEGEKKMRPCEIPSMTGKTASTYPGIYNAVFVVPKNAKNRDAAIKLMQFISSPEIAEKWEVYSKCPTGLRNRVSLNEFGTDAFSKLSKHIAEKYDSKLEETNLSKILFNSQNTIQFYPQEVVSGRMTASQALNSVRNQSK